jgi:hypothetical protein
MNKNPALSAFVAGIEQELNFAQVWIRRMPKGFELRHVADKEGDEDALQSVAEKDLRSLAQFTAQGAFRPLKSAPNLRPGWRAIARDEESLGLALNQLYPGAVADWFAAQSPSPPITSYREFTGRQTGMYRITTMLEDATAGAAIRACCHEDFCLKRRLWSVGVLPLDALERKSAIPCLEPCAILLEFARKIFRLEQEEKAQPLDPVEVKGRLLDAAEGLLNPDPTVAEGDFDSPRNPRRLRFMLEKTPIPKESTVN